MHRSRTHNFRSVHFAAGFLILLGSTFLPAQSNKKTSSAPPPPAKPSAPAKSAASAPQKASEARPRVAGQPPTPSSSRPSVAQTPFHPPQEKHAGGIQVSPKSKATQTKTGNLVVTRPNGKVSDVYDAKRGMTIHHGPNGSTRVSVERPDHSRIVAERGRPGYVQRGYSHNGHDYARRTYYFHGRAYDRFYRGYPYRGEYLNVYAPAYYYPAGFYGWAYNPWYSPAVYGWGWAGDPWYGYYGYYFAPSPFYPSASLWLTDYMISGDLSAAYQQQQETPDAESSSPESSTATPALTPAVKDMIANEVKNQLALENSEAQQNAQNQEPDPKNSGIARLLTDQQTHVFVVDSPLDLQDTSGNECTLSDGDVLNMLAPPASGAISVNVQVLSSKGSRECAKSDTVTVALIDLQDMQNHMRESIDQGLQELQAKQGQGGLPAAPPSAKSAPVNSAYTTDAPPPDPNGATEVNQQLADASEAEKQVLAQAQQQATPAVATTSTTSTSESQPVAPVSIKLGQSIDEVAASFGQPLKVIDLGSKKTYMYKDMKVIFKDGKVEDVQ